MSRQPRDPRQVAAEVDAVDHVRPQAGGELLGAGGVVGIDLLVLGQIRHSAPLPKDPHSESNPASEHHRAWTSVRSLWSW